MESCSAQWADWISAVGSILGGVAAAFAVVYAYLVGKRELAEWHHQTRTTKRAEIAGQVLAACFEACEALRCVSDDHIPTEWNGSLGKDKASWCAEIYAARWASVDNVFRRLHAAYGLTLAHLSEHAPTVADIEALKQSVFAAQREWLVPSRFNNTTAMIEPMSRAVGSEVTEQIETLEQASHSSFGPVARMEVPK